MKPRNVMPLKFALWMFACAKLTLVRFAVEEEKEAWVRLEWANEAPVRSKERFAYSS